MYRVNQNVTGASLYISHVDTMDVLEESVESESAMLKASALMIGYTGGGTQLSDAGER